MYESMEITQERVATLNSKVEVAELELGNSRLGLGVIMVMAAFVGVWGCVCLLNGIVQSQSIQELARGVLTAFTGI